MRRFHATVLVLLSAFMPLLAAAEPVLVADINIEGGGVLHPALFGEDLVFAYNGGEFGEEVWISDGTPAGTRLLVDVATGIASSEPADFVAIGDHLYFTAEDYQHGRQLWVYDADADSARIVDLINERGSAAPHSLVPWKGGLFFFANDGSSGHEPWYTDGTASGTRRIADIRNGSLGSSTGVPADTSMPFRERMYFFADDGVHGLELWRTDGTAAGTELHANLSGGSSSTFVTPGFAATSSHLFVAVNADGARRLIATDGSSVDTVGTIPATHLSVLADTLYFIGKDSRNRELWTSDGTDVSIVKNVVPDQDGEIPYAQGINALRAVGDRLFFSADTPEHRFDSELWTSDGSAAGTVFMHDTWPGGRGTPGTPHEFVPFDGSRFAFIAQGDAVFAAKRLWVGERDGSDAREVGSLHPGGAGVDAAKLFGTGSGRVFAIVKYGETENELWSSDGGAPVRLLSAMHGSHPGSPTNITAFDGAVYFTAIGSGESTALGNINLYRATLGAGASLLKDTNPGDGLFQGSDDGFGQPTAFAGRLFFSGYDGDDPSKDTHGRELWATDGTPAGTQLAADLATGTASSRVVGSNPHAFTVFGDVMLFAAGSDGDHLDWELHIARDGGETIELLKEINPGSGSGGRSQPLEMLVVGDTVFFTATDGSHGRELWKSDGTTDGTQLVKDIHPAGSGVPHDPRNRPKVGFGTSLVAIDDHVYFPADDGSGFDLWTSDGTAAGTSKLVDLDDVSDLVAIGDRLVFVATDASHGREIWMSDTAGNARRVTDIASGSAGADPQLLTAYGDQVAFQADDGVNGDELYLLDALSDELVFVDIKPGESDGSKPGQFVHVNGVLCFVADSHDHGRELWQTDGTLAGTFMVKDLNPGTQYADIRHEGQRSVLGDTLYFSATVPGFGNELWAFTPESGPQPLRIITIDVQPRPADRGVGIDQGALKSLPGTFDLLRQDEGHLLHFGDNALQVLGHDG